MKQNKYDFIYRMRRNRRHEWLRELVAETGLTVNDLVYPVFFCEGNNVKNPINSLPGQNVFSIDQLCEHVAKASDLGIKALALFPNTPYEKKSHDAQEAYRNENLTCNVINTLKQKFPHIGLIADIALDAYTLSGHDGVANDEGLILNDATVEILAKQAVNFAQAGCDLVGPSDMMDGRVSVIREALDAADYADIGILSYAVKYASSFYGPFRDATGTSACLKGDKKTYQMDTRNTQEAMREIALDIEEGADIIMIKPGLPYLDVIARAKDMFDVPVFAYHVSGEYAMIKHAAQTGCLDEEKAMLECLNSFKRAGADAILTYAAMDIANAL